MSGRLQLLKVKVADVKGNARQAFTSWAAFKECLEVNDTELDEQGQRSTGPVWRNVDLDPTPPENRTWAWYNFVVFYVALSFGNWTLGSTMIGIGLNWWQAIVVIFISQMISSVAMFFNSRCASVYHIGTAQSRIVPQPGWY